MVPLYKVKIKQLELQNLNLLERQLNLASGVEKGVNVLKALELESTQTLEEDSDTCLIEQLAKENADLRKLLEITHSMDKLEECDFELRHEESKVQSTADT